MFIETDLLVKCCYNEVGHKVKELKKNNFWQLCYTNLQYSEACHFEIEMKCFSVRNKQLPTCPPRVEIAEGKLIDL